MQFNDEQIYESASPNFIIFCFLLQINIFWLRMEFPTSSFFKVCFHRSLITKELKQQRVEVVSFYQKSFHQRIKQTKLNFGCYTHNIELLNHLSSFKLNFISYSCKYHSCEDNKHCKHSVITAYFSQSTQYNIIFFKYLFSVSIELMNI